jgi:7-carboxy-7-deazaguanine synthase
MLPVNEIFETIQGEASYTGTPSVFVRLQGCPVGCAWCDTKHTWALSADNVVNMQVMLQKVEDAPTFTNLDADKLALLVKNHSARHVVITGGEPCLYDLTEITTMLIDSGRTVQIETSGTHEIRCNPLAWVTVSPKVNMPGGYQVLDSAIERANEIKHPVGKMQDVDNLARLAAKRREGVPVWMQPLSQSVKATELCVQQAILRNWRVSIQTHKYMGVR